MLKAKGTNGRRRMNYKSTITIWRHYEEPIILRFHSSGFEWMPIAVAYIEDLVTLIKIVPSLPYRFQQQHVIRWLRLFTDMIGIVRHWSEENESL